MQCLICKVALMGCGDLPPETGRLMREVYKSTLIAHLGGMEKAAAAHAAYLDASRYTAPDVPLSPERAAASERWTAGTRAARTAAFAEAELGLPWREQAVFDVRFEPAAEDGCS